MMPSHWASGHPTEHGCGALTTAPLNAEPDIAQLNLKHFITLPKSLGPTMVEAVNLPLKTFCKLLIEPTMQDLTGTDADGDGNKA